MWLILGGLDGSFAQRFQDVQKNEESSFLPGSSESVRELTLAKRFPSGERFAAITVVRRDGGLKPRALAAIERASLAANPPVTGSRQVLVRGGQAPSPEKQKRGTAEAKPTPCRAPTSATPNGRRR